MVGRPFSSRVPADLAANRLAAGRSAGARADGRPIIDLTESNPTRAGFEYPADLLRRSPIHAASTYAPSAVRPARRAAARWRATTPGAGSTVDPRADRADGEHSEAYSLLFKLLADAGDEVLVPRPSYPLFDHLTRLDDVARRARTISSTTTGWTHRHASVERALTPRTRAILLVVARTTRPGRSSSAHELERLAALCAAQRRGARRRRGVRRLRARAGARARRRPRAGRPSDRALVFSLGGLSKSVGLPQVKLGVDRGRPGPTTWSRDALERLELICDTYLSVSTPVQAAAAELLDARRRFAQQIQARIAANYRTLVEQTAARARLPRACSRRRLVRGPPGAVARAPKKISSSISSSDRRAGASGLLLRFSARVVSGRQPARRRARSLPTASIACCGTSRRTSAAMRDRGRPAQSGLLIPLFSCPSTDELGHRRHRRSRAADRVAGGGRPARPAAAADQRDGAGQQSPYSAISAMAIDPIYIRAARPCRSSPASRRSSTGGSRAAGDGRGSRRAIDYAGVRQLKRTALRAAFERFVADEWRRDTVARGAFEAFLAEQAWWLDDYALFRAIHASEDERPWTEWPEPLQPPRRRRRLRTRAASSRARSCSISTCSGWRTIQWRTARAQRARRRAVRRPAVHGGRRQRRRLGAAGSVPPRRVASARRPTRSAPPARTGACRVYRWDVIAHDDFGWLRERARRSADLYDGYPRRSPRRLLPDVRVADATAASRSSRRRTSPSRSRSANASWPSSASPGRTIIAEDLGIVPDFVRASLARLGLPGLSRVPVGASLAQRRPAVPRSRPSIPRCRSPPPGRTTPKRWRSGGKRTTAEERQQISALPTACGRRRMRPC